MFVYAIGSPWLQIGIGGQLLDFATTLPASGPCCHDGRDPSGHQIVARILDTRRQSNDEYGNATELHIIAELEENSMSRLFAVTRSRGTAWNDSLSLEQQADWGGHADFMNALHAEGFVLLGGPLEGTSDVLLIIRADDANEIHARLSADSWTGKDLLRIKQIVPWTLRLGSLG